MLLNVMKRFVCVSSSDKTVKVWDSTSRQCIHTFHDHLDQVQSLATASGLILFGSVATDREAFLTEGVSHVFRTNVSTATVVSDCENDRDNFVQAIKGCICYSVLQTKCAEMTNKCKYVRETDITGCLIA